MAEKASCRDCRFFGGKLAPVPQPGGGFGGLMGFWPPTKETNWCGAFEPVPFAEQLQ